MLAIAILAAGKGTRMKSKLPKVLHPLAGKSLIDRVLSSTHELRPNRRLIVVGHQANLAFPLLVVVHRHLILEVPH